MPDRRTFLITCGGVVAAPAFAHPLAGGGVPTSLAAAPPKLVLRIDGLGVAGRFRVRRVGPDQLVMARGLALIGSSTFGCVNHS